jgi:hypothetical protein
MPALIKILRIHSVERRLKGSIGGWKEKHSCFSQEFHAELVIV